MWLVETKKFYVALSTVGTDFSLMSNLFPKRSRVELKVKISLWLSKPVAKVITFFENTYQNFNYICVAHCSSFNTASLIYIIIFIIYTYINRLVQLEMYMAVAGIVYFSNGKLLSYVIYINTTIYL